MSEVRAALEPDVFAKDQDLPNRQRRSAGPSGPLGFGRDRRPMHRGSADLQAGAPERRKTRNETAKGRAVLSTGARPSPTAEANEYFERGMFFLMAQFNLPNARKMLERALEIDPKFAEARGWYGFTSILEIDGGYSNDSNWLYKAEQELRRALKDDPDEPAPTRALRPFIFTRAGKT